MKKSKNNFPADLQVYGVIIMSDKSNILNFNYSMYKNRITDVKLVWWLKFNSKKNCGVAGVYCRFNNVDFENFIV